MRKIFELWKATFREFLKQRDYLLLLVPCDDSDFALLLKALRDLDRESNTDLFLLFATNFKSADQFLKDIAIHLREEHRLTNESAGPDLEELPPLPPEFLDDNAFPPDRLEAILHYSNMLVDPARGQHFLWGMGPSQIDDPQAYLQLLARLTPDPEIRPWMRGARIVARVPADFQLDLSPLAYAKRVQVKPFKLPPNFMEEELEAVSGNSEIAIGDRMQAEVQLAYLDYAHSRFDQAISRFLKALAYFQWAEIPSIEGLIICGLGDVARRQENWHDAEHWYECALVPAAKASNPMLMATIVQNLAVAAFREARFIDAEQRYSELVTLKRAMIDERGLAEALEWLGLSQERQMAIDRAVKCWEEGALICKAFELNDQLGPITNHLRRGYEALEMHESLESFDTEWALHG